VFHLTGIANVTTDHHLANFQADFERQAPLSLQRAMPNNWFSAFQQLITFLEKSPEGKNRHDFPKYAYAGSIVVPHQARSTSSHWFRVVFVSHV
jgi:hypothetical protein